MKKLLLFFTMSMFVLASCSDGTDSGEKSYKLETNPKQLTFVASQAPAQTIDVTAENIDWTLDDEQYDWLVIEKSGDKVIVTVEDNTETSERKATFTVESNFSTIPPIAITVTQLAMQEAEVNYILEVEPEFVFAPDEPAPRTLVVTAENVEWEVEAEKVDWLQWDKMENGVAIRVNRLDVKDSRQCKMTIVSKNENVPSREVTIVQRGVAALPYQTYIDSEAGYFGNSWGIGVDDYIMNLYSFSLGARPADKDGTCLHLEFFSETPEDPMDPYIPAGTYKVELAGKEFTAIPGEWEPMNKMYLYSTVVVFENGDVIRRTGVIGGTYTVVRNGDHYEMAFDLVLTDGHSLTGSFDARIDVLLPEEL